MTLVVTGAYTSGERVEPEGLVLDHGTVFDPYIQGWDGVLLISAEGTLSLHHVERITQGAATYNLRRRAERRAFVEMAKAEGMSAIQSHMLVVDGAVDVTPQPTAPRFRRRVLFSMQNGEYGIFDSGARTLTLFEAAQEVMDRFAPHMAFNLDMGSYDYCALKTSGRVVDCGTLDRSRTSKLSNVLVFHQDGFAGPSTGDK